ncbi:MAG: RES family NAD+ phosphorylase [Synechococcaceae cyanobacterium SM2_3_2]|nr:RES family NAD+ phosphorylase [Synechococcaceae cyanobacterium SM2_3_2]
MQVWRVCKGKHRATAFSGEGGLYASSRWMPQGLRVVYVAESLALASLEVFVHLESDRIPLVAIRARLPEGFAPAATGRIPMERVTVAQLEAMDPEWQSVEAYGRLQAMGKAWRQAGRTPVLQVPSAIVPVEFNYLLNPEHPDFRVVLDPPLEFRLDPRMWKQR